MNPITSVITFIKDLLRSLLEREPARLIAYGGAALLALALKGAELAGIVLPPDVQGALTLIGGFLLVELIRRIVYAPATVEAM